MHSAGGERARRVAAFEVFLGGACYGANATVYKMAFGEGFSWAQTIAAQMLFALVGFGALLLVDRMRGRSWEPVSARMFAKLAGLGMLTCGTGTFYCFAMSRLSVSLALTLLFQFAWIGLALQAMVERRLPSARQVAAVVLILVGTVFASGLYQADIATYDLLGIASGCLAAVCCALFIFLSGRVRCAYPPGQRGLLIGMGSLAFALCVCPDFFASGALWEGIAPFGAVVGILGTVAPVVLFGMGTPLLRAGVSTVMASSELPAGLLISVLILGDAVSLPQWAGVIGIVGGIVVSQVDMAPRVDARLRP